MVRKRDDATAPRIGGPAKARSPDRSGLTECGQRAGHAERQLDGHADVELRVGAAAHEVLVEQVLEVEAPDQRVALDAAVGRGSRRARPGSRGA